MNIFDLITESELGDLPEDANLAFVTFVKHASKRLADNVASIDQSERSGWDEANEARLGFMNVAIAFAKRLDIEPFASLSVPKVSEFSEDDHRQFKSDLDHYMTQIVLDNTIRRRSNSVHLAASAKDRIRQHIHHLKDCIDKSTITESRKAVLHKRILEFEQELEKSRLSLLSYTWITLQILAVPGALWTSADVVQKLVSNITQTIAEEKSAEDDNRKLPPAIAPKALSPPRIEDIEKVTQNAFDSDLDDDVPF